MLVQNPTFPGFGLGPEDFPLKPEVRGAGSMMVICCVGNISGTVPLVSSQCFPPAGFAAELKFCSDWDLSCTLNDLVSGGFIHEGSFHSLQVTKVVLLY